MVPIAFGWCCLRSRKYLSFIQHDLWHTSKKFFLFFNLSKGKQQLLFLCEQFLRLSLKGRSLKWISRIMFRLTEIYHWYIPILTSVISGSRIFFVHVLLTHFDFSLDGSGDDGYWWVKSESFHETALQVLHLHGVLERAWAVGPSEDGVHFFDDLSLENQIDKYEVYFGQSNSG